MAHKQSIVIIDDTFDNIISFKALLKEFYPDIDVFYKTNGKEGIDLIKSIVPDVVLLDLFMPGMDGYEVCTAIKSNENISDIPIVMITASKGDKDVKTKALECGAEAFLSKPVEVAEFIAQIRSMLKISEANYRQKTENERLSLLVDEKTRELKLAHEQTLKLYEKLKHEYKIRIQSEEALNEAQEIASIANFTLNLKNYTFSWSRAALSIFEITFPYEIEKYQDVKSYIHPDDLDIFNELDSLTTKGFNQSEYVIRLIVSNKKLKHCLIHIKSIQVENQTDPFIFGTVQDITSQFQHQEELKYISEHDYLTGLYNRGYFEKMVQFYDQPKYYPLSMIIGDINGLKLVNDSFGHQHGDEVLKWAAKVLKMYTTSDEVVARLGGDEFVVLLPNRSESEVEELISQMKSVVYSNKEVPLTLSISYGYAAKKDETEDFKKVFQIAEDFMYRHKITESSSMRSKSVDLILNALFAKSPRELGHSKRVSDLCEQIARALFTDEDEINQIRIAGLLHDIGKIEIDEAILNKNGKLTFDEFEEIKKHSEIGYRILSSVKEFSELSRYVLEHHEKIDGTGYPNNLKGEQISIQAKIISIADSYDAMTSDRSYRKGLSQSEAIDEMIKYMDTQFDAKIVKVFFENVLNKQPS